MNVMGVLGGVEGLFLSVVVQAKVELFLTVTLSRSACGGKGGGMQRAEVDSDSLADNVTRGTCAGTRNQYSAGVCKDRWGQSIWPAGDALYLAGGSFWRSWSNGMGCKQMECSCIGPLAATWFVEVLKPKLCKCHGITHYS
jgi:hypothetical protein